MRQHHEIGSIRVVLQDDGVLFDESIGHTYKVLNPSQTDAISGTAGSGFRPIQQLWRGTQTQLQQVMESLLRGNETEVCIIGDHDPPLIITPKPRAPKTFGPEEIRALTTKLLTATNEIQASSIRITQFAMRFGETQENHLAHFAAALPELAATVAPGLQEVVIDLGSGEAFARADELLRGLLPPT